MWLGAGRLQKSIGGSRTNPNRRGWQFCTVLDATVDKDDELASLRRQNRRGAKMDSAKFLGGNLEGWPGSDRSSVPSDFDGAT
jgi:hypothetical protein